MQGTWHVRSLIRLFIGAALLCLAWLVLTSGHASAAERPAPAQPLSDLSRTLPLVDRAGLETVLGSVLGKPSAPTERPADRSPQTVKSDAAPTRKPMAKKPSAAKTSDTKHPVSKAVLATTIDEAVRQVVPVLEQVDTSARSTVDTGLALVTDVADAAAELPLAGRPFDQVTDAVVALVRTLPVVDVPSPIVPLPIGDRTPTDVVPIPVPGSLDAVPTAPDALRATLDDAIAAARSGAAWPEDAGLSRAGSSDRTVAHAAPAGDRGPTAPGAPFESAPALPGQPSPTGGASSSTGDQAVAAVGLVLPNPSMFGRSSADWRVPRGLPAQPGTRPD